MIIIHGDGSYSIPKGKGGYAIVEVKLEQIVYERCWKVERSTSRRVELLGAIEAIKYAAGEELTLYTDSMYVVEGIKFKAAQWASFNWKRTNGLEVKNSDLWRILLSMPLDKVTVKKVKGHSGDPFNDFVDSLAKSCY